MMYNIRNGIFVRAFNIFIDASQQSSSEEEFGQGQSEGEAARAEGGAQSRSFLYRREAEIQAGQGRLKGDQALPAVH
jgi:hypothetical protein